MYHFVTIQLTMLWGQLRKISMVIHCLLTLLLPAWTRAVASVKLQLKKLPWDVRTQWNSMYQMLSVALEYRKAVKHMTEVQANNLRWWELNEHEWKIVLQLCDILQVSNQSLCGSAPLRTCSV